MKKEALAKLIHETKPLLSSATPEQKLRLMHLIREALRQNKRMLVQENKQNTDYLEEK
jgi:gamma-glutamyl phosphate reductase